MDEKPFIRYLRYGKEIYDSDPDATSEEGGFLIPKKVEYYRLGLKAKIWRYLGQKFHKRKLYEKGIRVAYPCKVLFESFEKLGMSVEA